MSGQKLHQSSLKNLLGAETSPYLLQHAENPVHWQPWGEEAFEQARLEDRPIFLSIGYSSCHWCHVMEKESFSNEEVATILNRHFVCIKVDREELPDVDEVYMSAVQAMTGSGGWPLSVFLTSDRKPFYGGTYFPLESQYGLPSFRELITEIAELWTSERLHLEENAEKLVQAIQSYLGASASPLGDLRADLPEIIAEDLRKRYDPEQGGFGRMPKFPPITALQFLLRHHARTGKVKWLNMATRTLDSMARGGIYDQLGGGFHRYATDAEWRTPHFEKMLPDNALLADIYLAAFQITHSPLYRRVAAETLDFLLREMRLPDGGFASALDADSGGVEGSFYLWKTEEFAAVLGSEDGAMLARFYGLTDPDRPGEAGAVLYQPRMQIEFARREGFPAGKVEMRLQEARHKLLEARDRRTRPGRDDKAIAAWNAMTVSALAHGAQILDEERFLEAAIQGAAFLIGEMRADESLRHCRSKGVAKVPGYLDDYAHTIHALLDLYETVFDLGLVDQADNLAREMLERFWDAEGRGFFHASEEHTPLPARSKPFYDGAQPAGNAVAATALLRLHDLLQRPEYGEKAHTVLVLGQSMADRYPQGLASLVCAGERARQPSTTVVIAGHSGREDTLRLLRVAYSQYLPDKAVICFDPDSDEAAICEECIPFLFNRRMIDGKATAYFCTNFACGKPVTDPAALAGQMQA